MNLRSINLFKYVGLGQFPQVKIGNNIMLNIGNNMFSIHGVRTIKGCYQYEITLPTSIMSVIITPKSLSMIEFPIFHIHLFIL